MMKHSANLGLDVLVSHQGFVRSVAARLLRDGSDVDEVEQLTWISWWKRAGLVGDPPRGWLHQVVRKHSLNLLRSKSRVRARERLAAKPESTITERVETGRLLVERVMQISQVNRKVILLRYYEELSLRAIALQLGVSPQTVKGRLQRGLAELRTKFDADGADEKLAWRERLTGVLAAPALPLGAGLLRGTGLVACVLGLAGGVWWGLGITRSLSGESVGFGHLPATPELLSEITPALAAVDEAAVMESVQPVQRQALNVAALRDGEVTLHIGEAFVFGAQGPVPDGDRSQFDLYCQDIRNGVSLACLRGGAEAKVFPSSVGLPIQPLECLALLPSAPMLLPERDLWLRETCRLGQPGLGFARGLDGRTYKLCLVELIPHVEALKRTVRIRYEALIAIPGGGFMRVPTTEGRPSDEVLRAIQLAIERGDRIPNQNRSKDLGGNYEAVDELLAVASLSKSAYLSLSFPLTSFLRIDSRGAVFASAGIAPTGRMELHKYGAMGVLGSMAGHVLVDSYGYVYIDGTLDGTLEIRSYATVYLSGDLRGTMNVRSYTDAYFGGAILGTLDTKGSGWCDFYFDGNYGAVELAQMGDDFAQITLHVRYSDLGLGKHNDVGSWRRVFVGEELWDELGR